MTSTNDSTGVASRGALLVSAALSGAGVMVMELTAARALAPWFGTSLYVWTNVIGVVLLALAFGYWLGGRLADRRPESTVLGRVLLIAAVVSIPAPFVAAPLGEWLLPSAEALSPFVATGHIVRGSLVVTLVLFAPPLFLLGMVGPFVTRCLVDSGLDGGAAAGRTLCVSTLGSLVGTYLPAHLLIEGIGVRATLLCATALFVVAAAILLAKGRPRAIAAGLLGLTAGLAGWASSMPIRGPLESSDGWTETAVVSEHESAYQYVRVTRWKNDEGAEQLRLSLDEGVTEFHSVKPQKGYLTGFYYDYFAVLPELFGDRASKPVDAIVLGGGAGTMGRMFRGLHDDAMGEVWCVEIDPLVAAMHEDFGFEAKGADRMVVGDARVVLATTGKTFDLIVLDAYAKQIAIPPHLGTVEFFDLVRSRLSVRGVFAINVSAPDLEGQLTSALVKTLREVFSSVAVVSVPGSWNAVLLASSDEERSFRPQGGPDPLADVRKQFLKGLIPAPESSADALVLRDDRAPLEQLARAR